MSNAQTKLKELREAKGISQEKLAEMSGLHRVTIAKYETTGRGMTLYSAEKLASALGCTIDVLLKGD